MKRRDAVIKPVKKPKLPWDDSDPTTYFRELRHKMSMEKEKRLLKKFSIHKSHQ